MYLSYIKLDSEIGVKIVITKNSLVVAFADSRIIDYSLENLNTVKDKEEFEYPLYDYTFIYPFVMAYGPNTGLIYILAWAPNGNDLVLMVYRSGVERIRSLVKIIMIEENADLGKN